MRPPTPPPPRRQRRVLQTVATIEFLKGVFVTLMGICALLLVHKDAWLYAESVLAVFHISTDRRIAQMFLDFADNVTDAKLWAAAWLAFAYSTLRFIEGYGLWRCRTWAEWVAAISGTLLCPGSARVVSPRHAVALWSVNRQCGGRALHGLRHHGEPARAQKSRLLLNT